MNKRDLVLSLLERDRTSYYIPAAFFLHFEPTCHRGWAAVEKHLEFFNFTGMDIIKIQYEHTFPKNPDLLKPGDWEKIPIFDESFFEEPLAVVKGLVERAKKDALVIVTLYSPFMVAGQINGQETISGHILENPVKAKKGVAAVTASMINFVRSCIRYGVDGFYTSTQGAEAFRFPNLEPFFECIKPYDLEIMNEVNEKCPFNILHICDYHGGYNDLSPFQDYPGDIVNCGLHVGERILTGKEVSTYFNRPFMGGMERKKEIVSGSETEIQQTVDRILENAPPRFFLGADCTVPSETRWENLRVAIERAHKFRL
jgi:uroporphyrinogen decarboxylase